MDVDDLAWMLARAYYPDGFEEEWEDYIEGEHFRAQAVVVAALLAQARTDAAEAGRKATLDPGAFVKRGRDAEGEYERLDQWQAHALRAALAPRPSAHTPQDTADAAGEGDDP
jgi:hypothetical protein